ncbi:hypothetical protein SH501x_002306 [Pirellulaceae bacterium SH501]
MPLLRSQSQGGGDVAEHYSDRDGDAAWRKECNARMRSLITALNDALPKTIVWGLTSHDTLCLMSMPAYDAGPWYVAIDSRVGGGFEVTYRPPEGELPIPESEIRFCVSDLGLAIERIKKAMALTMAWADSPDLIP